jgi:hypothetical protein
VFPSGGLQNNVALGEAAFAYSAVHSSADIPLLAPAETILAAAPLTSPAAGFTPWKRELSKTELCDAATIVAEEHRLPIQFFTNLIYQESGFQTHVVSWAGAQGIAQFMPRTAAENGLLDPFDPIPALKASARFLADLQVQFGNLGLAAAAYNGGPGRVQAWLQKRGTLPSETRQYVQRITGLAPEAWLPSSPAEKLVEMKFPTLVICTTTSMIARAEIGAMTNSVVLGPRLISDTILPTSRRVGTLRSRDLRRLRARPGSMMARWCGVNPGSCNKRPVRLAAMR